MMVADAVRSPGRCIRPPAPDGARRERRMATSREYIDFVADQIRGTGFVRYRKMFGEYMVYVNDKPLLLVCDSQVFVKPLEAVREVMKDAEMGPPYPGAKEYYLLNIDDREFSQEVVRILERVTPLPKPKKSKVR
jgi:TfoX/Sxy family transcriptional regulator of competence genes